MRTIAEWLQRPMILVWIGFIAFAEILSWETRHWLLCFVYVDEGQEGGRQSDQQECATFHVALFKLAIWGSRLLEDHKETVTAIATVFIALFTLTLWRATNRMWESGERQVNLIGSIAERQARQTQASIDLARAEFISTHRPLMKVKLVNLVEIEDERAGVQFTVVNVGQTAAHVTGSCAKADFFSETDWPHPNDYEGDNIIPPRRFVTGATDTYTISTVHPVGLMTVHAGEDEAKLQLRFYGYIVYSDDSGNIRTTYFCRRYNPRWDRFDPVDRTDYDSAD